MDNVCAIQLGIVLEYLISNYLYVVIIFKRCFIFMDSTQLSSGLRSLSPSAKGICSIIPIYMVGPIGL